MTEWQASEYSRQSGLQMAMAQRQLGRLTLAGDERVLDIGCGDGNITAEIALRVPQGSAVGVDPSREMIAFAAGQFSSPTYQNLQFEVADARSIPYRDEFDLIVSFNALHWVPEQLTALTAIRQALKPGGRALLRMVYLGARRSLEAVIEEVRLRSPWAGHFADFQQPFAHFEPSEYQALAEQAGLTVVRVELEDQAWDFETRAGFVAFARVTFVEWTQHLPDVDRDQFIGDVLDTYAAVAADTPAEANTFKFYQMEVELLRADEDAQQ